jgi:hypothetical protein
MALAVLISGLPTTLLAQGDIEITKNVVGVLPSGDVILEVGKANLICSLERGVWGFWLSKCEPLSLALPIVEPQAQLNREALISIFEANGCQMSRQEAEVIFPLLGYSVEQIPEVAEALFAEGLIEEGIDEMVKLKTENCL